MNGPGASRPDPDALLRQVEAEAAQGRRGRLKIFFGACAGVGKTFAMLAAARSALEAGVPLAAGVVETHGRADTEAMARGLPRIALRELPHRGQVLREFDLDAALAFGGGQPGALVLVDELAHSNAPGSRHPKRWQDVAELLAAGIDVWTTMNVQHLESLNDIVSGITGVRVRETVPDRVFDEADEVVVADLPPDELLQRLKAGKVYLPRPAAGRSRAGNAPAAGRAGWPDPGGEDPAERAAAHFFRKGNLLALRELALRRTADRVDGQMQAWRRGSAGQPVWPNRESLLACIGPGGHAEKVVRSSARLAAQLEVGWHAVLVETPAFLRLPQARRGRALKALRLAESLGAATATVTAPEAAPALVRYAREHNLPRLVMGRRERRLPWRVRWRASVADRVAREADDLDVLQVAVPALPHTPAAGCGAGAAAQAAADAAARHTLRWPAYLGAAAACALTALLATPLLGVLELTNIVMLFLLAVVGVAVTLGRGPAVLAAFVGVGLFDLFFVQPRFSFAVTDVQYLVTFGVMLVVALVIGQLTAGLRFQARAATQREQRVRHLYEMSRDLSAALVAEQVAGIGARFLAAEFGARSALLAADAHDRLQTLPGATAEVEPGLVQWAFDRGEAAGQGTGTLPASACLVLPLKAPMRLRGVLAVQPGDRRLLGPEERRLLDTCASLLAISLERIHYIEVAQASTVQIESERLRNSLLSAISHDLRTPLASLVGLAETLALTRPPPTPGQLELAQAIRQSAMRMNALVDNLLDMARLESGAVRLNRQWQPLEEVVGSALAASAPSLAGRPIDVSLADDLPLLHLDAVLMERVFVNLLENAAKYTPAGSAIGIAARLDGEGTGAAVTVEVDDQGPGLPPGREEAIFQKFERGSRESATAGVGLGLAICRAIVQAHGGDIDGHTRPGGGARFRLRLPVGEPPSDDGTHAQAGRGVSGEGGRAQSPDAAPPGGAPTPRPAPHTP